LREAEWDILIRSARSARLLGVLSARVGRLTPAGVLPEPVSRQLLAGTIEARFRRQKALYLLRAIESQLCVEGSTPVLLKGAAYIAQGLEMAEGRLPADVDVMVRRPALGAVERALLDAGWEFEKTDPYDQLLPGLVARTAADEVQDRRSNSTCTMESCLRSAAETRHRGSVCSNDAGRWRAFSGPEPADQVLHAAAHLFRTPIAPVECRIRRHRWSGALLRGEGCLVLGDPREAREAASARQTALVTLTFGRDWLATPVPIGLKSTDGRSPVWSRWLVKRCSTVALSVAPDSLAP
jgi:hypothetical protein